MLLGDIITRLEDEAMAMQTLVGLSDIVLLTRVEAAAATEGLTIGGFAARAVDRFSSQASDEDWVTLIGVMGRTGDPGQACLRNILQFALRPPEAAAHACGCGS
ncbi:hypothetical protein [Bosea sp. (in: a-proteobacteria)]|uniref:hypothetical protein n=1 Tax=Bosea sp. (in: a-proteobacteria) TaxID=1871050 RepID=UPI0026325E4D|nr:hypothetical protein [Bosea sp. (in: a-proteobacteria)]MCO5091186.1 hypothetical protein [Bosea sp. (in: a-proteobacteria)]